MGVFPILSRWSSSPSGAPARQTAWCTASPAPGAGTGLWGKQPGLLIRGFRSGKDIQFWCFYFLLQEQLGYVERKEEQFPIGEHFSRPDHSASDISVQILDIAPTKLSWDRKASKENWMKKLGAKDAGNE